VPDYPRVNGRQPYQDYFVVVEGKAVHGGYRLQHQTFWIRDRVEMIASGPGGMVSEGLVNPRFNMAGALALVDALRRQQSLYTLGMGGMQQRFPMLLKESQWNLDPVPFYFKVIHPTRFLAEMRHLPEKPGMARLCELLRRSYLGNIVIAAAQLRPPKKNDCSGEIVREFGSWADEVWQNSLPDYTFAAVRDAAALAVVHAKPHLLRMRVSRADRVIGWVVMLDTPMSNHKQFGNLRVGSIVDCMAGAVDAESVVQCATKFLEGRGVDIIVSNQSHRSWRRAMSSCGFLRGPSNFVLALSPHLLKKLQPIETLRDQFHMTRGDGDGPINL
jgi:hypothetical protein